MKKIFICVILPLYFYINSSNTYADSAEALNWLNNEISGIIGLYMDTNINDEKRLEAIKETVEKSFAGESIARFVVGGKWNESDKNVQEDFIVLFKEHLYLTVGSLMQSYSNQTYNLVNAEERKKSLYTIDMELIHNEQKTMITWVVKEHKKNYYVYDLIIADISLMRTKRSEFNSVLKKRNLRQLNDILKKQNVKSYNNLIN